MMKKTIKKLKNLISILYATFYKQKEFIRDIEFLKMSLGRIESRQIKYTKDIEFEDVEFKVFSEWGEDGILSYILDRVLIEDKCFIEFGVENYKESNTKFLLKNRNWSGLVIDGNKDNISEIKNDEELYWRYNLKAVNQFITRENINDIILNNGLGGEINPSVLSIDIDGNDYWVWEAITCINPVVVICEYNSIFGMKKSLTTPYDPEFIRWKYHDSWLVFGASIKALVSLGKRKGYALVAGNKAGGNLFFVREDAMGELKEIKIKEAYRMAQSRQARKDGKLIFAGWDENIKMIEECLIWDLDEKKMVKIKDVL